MKLFLLVLMLLAVGGCQVFENDAQRSVARGWAVPAAYTSADVRIITNRQRAGTHRTVICAEPSADVAKAIATAFQVAGKGGNGSVNVALGLGGASSEAVSELAGRSTALLGLRDGLYRACEAYGNGAIGDDAYALILSRYGQLMTTLFLGQDITNYVGASGAGVAKADAPTVNINYPGSTSVTDTGAGSGDSGGKDAGASGGKTATNAAAKTIKDPQPPAVPDRVAVSRTTTGQADTAKADPPTASEAAASALRDMNRDYFNLDQNILQVLLVACVNDNDNTRAVRQPGQGGYGAGTNRFLQRLCPHLTIDTIEKMASEQIRLLKAVGSAPAPASPIARGGKTPAPHRTAIRRPVGGQSVAGRLGGGLGGLSARRADQQQ